MALNLSPRVRKVLRYVAIGVFSVIVFVVALQLSFPYSRIKEKLVEQLSDKYDVQIGEVERGIMPGRVYFNDVNIRTRQVKPDDAVTTMLIKRLQVDVGILPLLSKTIRIDLDARIGSGTLAARVSLPNFGREPGFRLSAKGDALPGTGLPMRALLGLPITGTIDFSVALDLPAEKGKGRPYANWPKAQGAFEIECLAGCTFGDGKTKLKPLVKNSSQQAMVGEGIDFGEVNIDSLIAKAEIKKGKLEVTRFDAKSKDGELHVDFAMTLDKQLNNSVVAGCLRFKGSKILEDREPKTFAALQTTGAELRSDGLFHIRLTDRLNMMKRLNQECGPNVKSVTNGENFGGPTQPPHLTVMPEHPKPVVPPIQTPPNQTPPIQPPPIQPPPPPPPAAAEPGSNMTHPPGPEGETAPTGSAAAGLAGSSEHEPPLPPASGTPPTQPSRRH